MRGSEMVSPVPGFHMSWVWPKNRAQPTFLAVKNEVNLHCLDWRLPLRPSISIVHGAFHGALNFPRMCSFLLGALELTPTASRTSPDCIIYKLFLDKDQAKCIQIIEQFKRSVYTWCLTLLSNPGFGSLKPLALLWFPLFSDFLENRAWGKAYVVKLHWEI